MAKKAYVGINGIAKNVNKMYVGVNGVARKVVKGYVGVNGVARLFWDGGGSSVIPSWDFWSSVSGNRNNYNIAMWNNDVMYKVNNKIAYFGVAIIKNLRDDSVCAHPIYISPDRDATSFSRGSSSGTETFTSQTSIVDENITVWHVCYFPQRLSWRLDTIRPVGVLINSADNPYEYDSTYDPDTPSHQKTPLVNAIIEAAQNLLNRVFAVPFHEDYQVGTTYTLNSTDIQKTIRKAYGTFLHRNVGDYSTSVQYTTLSDNADAVITELMRRLTLTNATLIEIAFYGSSITVTHLDWESQVANAHLRMAKQTAYHYDYYLFETEPYEYGVESDYEEEVSVDSSGNITYTTYYYEDTDIPDIFYRAGLYINNYGDMYLTNLGIDL